MKIEQKLGLAMTHVGSSGDPLNSYNNSPYLGFIEDFKKDPYIYTYVKGKIWL